MVRILKKLFITSLILGLIAALFILIINFYICRIGKANIIKRGKYQGDEVDCVIVLGAKVWDNVPSYMLRDRLDVALEVYEQGYAKKILVSGDHANKNYDEVNVMRDYLIEAGVPKKDIFMDHAGLNTYSTMVRAKEVFKVESCIISTQKYHLYRSVYLAVKQEIDVTGIPCDVYISRKLPYFKLREVAARVKSFLYAEIFKPIPILGEEIPISGNGRATEDGLT